MFEEEIYIKYFGTDGIRDRVDNLLSNNLLFKIGYSLRYFNVKNILIGYDTRNSNQTLLFSLSSGIMASGINVIDGMVLPTSAVAYYTYIKNMIGVVITASHNKYQYNGIKIFRNGRKISHFDEEKLEDLIDEAIITDEELEFGHYLKSLEPAMLYEKYLSSFVCKNDFRVAFDFGNGALSLFGQKVLNKLGPGNVYYGNHPTGFNINDSGSTKVDALINIIKRDELDYGFAYDGDGDRVVMIDKDGYIYSGDELAFMIAKYLSRYDLLNNKRVVLSKMANLGIINYFKDNNFDVFLSDVGDKNVISVMDNVFASLGAEPSGHLILKDYLPTGDGLLSSIFLLNILNNQPLSTYRLPKYPVIEKNYPINSLKQANKILDNLDILNYLNDYHNNYPTTGKIILRKSGTESLIRLYLTNKDQQVLDACFKELDLLINNLLNE